MGTRIIRLGGDTWKMGRCEAAVGEATRRWRDHCNEDHRCTMKIHYEVEGKKLCIRHAGARALEILLAGGMA